MTLNRRQALSLLAAPLAPAFARAQALPKGPVRIVVPYSAGGGVDGMARPIAEALGRLWGTTVIVENKPGASTIIGTDAVAKAKPDGTTLLFTSESSITSNPHLFPNLPYDPLKDLVPVTQVIDLSLMVVVHPSLPVKSLKELVAYAKQKPGELNYASYGPGSQPNLLYEMLGVETGTHFTGIPYKGIAPALLATLSGEVQMTLGGVATSKGYLDAGRLRGLALARAERSPIYPDIPTLREAGYPDIDPRSWFGFFAPAGTPPALVRRISDDIVRVVRDPDLDRREISGKGYTPVGSTPEAFKAFIADDYAYKARMIKATGIKVN